jgi:hypothetical protein
MIAVLEASRVRLSLSTSSAHLSICAFWAVSAEANLRSLLTITLPFVHVRFREEFNLSVEVESGIINRSLGILFWSPRWVSVCGSCCSFF